MIAPALANHLLSRETWARERLARHAGRAFALAVGPLSTTLAVDAAGMLAAPPEDQAADVTLRISPLDLPSFLADPSRWNELVSAEGDAELAATLAELAHTLPWFVERAFASALGPIAGQRVADAGRAMLEFPAYAASRFVASIASYATDEARIAARGIELQAFVGQVATLAAQADALGTRIEALAARVG